MLQRPRDYQVAFKREETIAAIALQWRKEAGHENSAEFNICNFIEVVLSKGFTKKGRLQIAFYDMSPNAEPAYVTFESLTLHVDCEIWNLANLGDPYARFVLAHEVGHVLLHDNGAKAFSNDPRDQIRSAVNEESAEWQANTFGAHFLLPTHLVEAYSDSIEISKSCSVERYLAEERLQSVQDAKRPRIKIEGDFCIPCGEFTKRVEGRVRCPTCGQ
jgi:hypothetical protein